MSPRPTISDVARVAGVSRTTVSHALRGLGQVESGTRQRVIDAAAELGYRPSVRAQSLRLGTTRSLALMSSMPAAVSAGPSRLGFFMEIAAAAAESALLRGYSVVLVPPTETVDSPFHHLDVDGAILVEPTADDALAEELRLRYLPFVTIGRQPGGTAPCIDLDARAGTTILLEHLRAQGARSIALVVGSSLRHSHLGTLASYRDFCEMTGQLPMISEADERLGERGGYDETARLLQEHPELDAVCVTVDAFATGALAALTEAGRRVGDQVLVATRYDGLRAKLAQPPLTALDLHLAAVSAEAVDLLLEQLHNPHAVPSSRCAPTATLVPRASTAAS